MTAPALATAVRLTVNGVAVSRTIEARMHLVDFLRDTLGLTGSHVGCEHGVCGACTVRVDGHAVRGCLVLAASLDGSAVETIEGMTETGALRALQDAFLARNALQCGFCTAGMLVSAHELLEEQALPSREAIRAHMSGNYCRCTGYHAIVDAIEMVAKARAAERIAPHERPAAH